MLTDRSFKVRAGKVLKNLDLFLKNPTSANPTPVSFGYTLEVFVNEYFDNDDDRQRFYSSEFGVIFATRSSEKLVSYLTKGVVVKPASDEVESALDDIIAKTPGKSRKKLGSHTKEIVKTATKTAIKEAIRKPAVGRKPVVASKPSVATGPHLVTERYYPEKAAEDIFPDRSTVTLKKSTTTGTDVVISFDDTGSMSACRHITRKLASEVSADLLVQFGEKLNVGIIIHGDYCDGPEPVVKLGLGKDWVGIKRFLDAPRSFCGGDAPECYEAALHAAYGFDWRVNSEKVLVIMGDEVPHEPSYLLNKARLNWKVELKNLVAMGVKIISVQALGRRHADKFYATLAEKSGGYHLQLTQLNQIADLLQAICYQSCGELDKFEQKINKVSSGASPAFKRNLDVLAGRKAEVKTVEGLSDFQMFSIDHDVTIRDFVTGLGLKFKPGCGYYEFSKSETVQEYKKVVVQDRSTEVFHSDVEGRKVLRLPFSGSVTINPRNFDKKYRFFIQSTSYTRILKAGTIFLYDNRGEATTWRTARDRHFK